MADDEARIVSVIGGAKRTDRWQVAESTSVLTLFGRCVIDLRSARTEVTDELWFSVVSVFATVDVIVPEGTIVQPSGMAFFGSASCLVPASARPGPLPPIEIENITVLGRLRIRTQPPKRRLRDRVLRRRVVAAPPDAPLPLAPPVPPMEGDAELGLARPPARSSPELQDLDKVLADVLGDEMELPVDDGAAAEIEDRGDAADLGAAGDDDEGVSADVDVG